VAAILPIAPIVALIVSLSLMGASIANCAPSILSGLQPIIDPLKAAASAFKADDSLGALPAVAHFSPWKLQAAVATFHLLSGFVGFYIPKLFGFNEVCGCVFYYPLYLLYIFVY
jgi:hypothetical protein